MQNHFPLLPITMLAVSCTINLRKQRTTPFQIDLEIMPSIPLKIFKLNLCNSLINWTCYMKLIVSTLSYKYWHIFLRTLDSSAPFEVTLKKLPPAGYITETIKNEINNYILCYEYMSIVDDAAKLQNETE